MRLKLIPHKLRTLLASTKISARHLRPDEDLGLIEDGSSIASLGITQTLDPGSARASGTADRVAETESELQTTEEIEELPVNSIPHDTSPIDPDAPLSPSFLKQSEVACEARAGTTTAPQAETTPQRAPHSKLDVPQRRDTPLPVRASDPQATDIRAVPTPEPASDVIASSADLEDAPDLWDEALDEEDVFACEPPMEDTDWPHLAEAFDAALNEDDEDFEAVRTEDDAVLDDPDEDLFLEALPDRRAPVIVEPAVEDWRLERRALALAADLPFTDMNAAEAALPDLIALLERFPWGASQLGIRRLVDAGADLTRILHAAELKAAWSEDSSLWLRRRRAWGGGWTAECDPTLRHGLSWHAADRLLEDRSPIQALDLIRDAWRDDWMRLSEHGGPAPGPGAGHFWMYPAWLASVDPDRQEDDHLWASEEYSPPYAPPHQRLRWPSGDQMAPPSRLWGDAISSRGIIHDTPPQT